MNRFIVSNAYIDKIEEMTLNNIDLSALFSRERGGSSSVGSHSHNYQSALGLISGSDSDTESSSKDTLRGQYDNLAAAAGGNSNGHAASASYDYDNYPRVSETLGNDVENEYDAIPEELKRTGGGGTTHLQK